MNKLMSFPDSPIELGMGLVMNFVLVKEGKESHVIQVIILQIDSFVKVFACLIISMEVILFPKLVFLLV